MYLLYQYTLLFFFFVLLPSFLLFTGIDICQVLTLFSLMISGNLHRGDIDWMGLYYEKNSYMKGSVGGWYVGSRVYIIVMAGGGTASGVSGLIRMWNCGRRDMLAELNGFVHISKRDMPVIWFVNIAGLRKEIIACTSTNRHIARK